MLKRVLAVLCGIVICGAGTALCSPLEIEVIQTSEASLSTSMTLVKAEKGAVLIDAPFTRADAHRIVAAVLDSGRTLQAVFVTHDHPDHFFNVEVIADAFPNARVIASPQVVEDIWKSIPHKMKRWGPMLGANAPRHPTAPAPLEGDRFELEGHTLQVLGPMQGDHVHATAVWIPDAKALIAGDLLFNEVHLWLGESLAPERAAWLSSLDTLAALKPALVVAGHKKPGLPDDASALSFTRKYLETFERAVGSSKTAAQLAQRMRAAFPNSLDYFDNFILDNSTKVAMGEMPPWQE